MCLNIMKIRFFFYSHLIITNGYVQVYDYVEKFLLNLIELINN